MLIPSRKSPPTRIKLPFVLVVALSTVLLQAWTCTVAQGRTFAAGTWGGEHVIVEVSQTGAEVEFDCAHGQITQPIKLNKNGDFDVAGTFTREHGGPVLRDENTQPTPARYSGHVDGDTLILKITLASEKEKEEVGSYTLTRGAHPMLRKCR